MRTLEIAGKTIKIDTEKLGEQVYKLHADDKNKLTLLKFGMLDAKIIDSVDDNLKEQIFSEYSKDVQNSHSKVLESFFNACSKDITNGVYKKAQMVV